MNAPNREAAVADLLAAHWPFPNDDTYDDVRLSVLLKYIIPGLNKIDGGKWGCLTKTDQGNKVPGDILVWRDTNEVIDCLDSRGATWNNLGVNGNGAWIWTQVNGPLPNPTPVPTPLPVPSGPTNQDVINTITAAKIEIIARLDKHVSDLNKALAPVVLKIMSMK